MEARGTRLKEPAWHGAETAAVSRHGDCYKELRGLPNMAQGVSDYRVTAGNARTQNSPSWRAVPAAQRSGQVQVYSELLLKCVSSLTMEPKSHSPPSSAPCAQARARPEPWEFVT